MKIYILIICIILTIVSACVNEQFVLNEGNKELIVGLKISGTETIDEVNDNSVMLYDGGFIALKRYGITDLVSDVTVDIREGEGAMFAIRCASNNYENHPAIILTFSVNGLSVQEKGKPIINLDKYKASKNEPSRIVFRNDCKRYDILVDCDTVYTGFTEIPNTEYLLIKTLPKSKVLLTGISMVEKGEGEDNVEKVIYK